MLRQYSRIGSFRQWLTLFCRSVLTAEPIPIENGTDSKAEDGGNTSDSKAEDDENIQPAAPVVSVEKPDQNNTLIQVRDLDSF